MSGSAAGDNTPPSGPPDLPAVLSFQEQQEVCPPLPMYPTFPPPHARATKPEILELCSRFPRVCRLELCSPVYLHLRISSEGISAGALLPRCRYSEVSWLRSHLSHPSNGLAVERGRNGLAYDASRPATILKSPGQARQTLPCRPYGRAMTP